MPICESRARAAGTSAPSPELCRLLNVAAIDSLFFAQLRAAPACAAACAALAPEVAFGCPLPDPVLGLPPVCLTQTDWMLVGRLRARPTLAAMWQCLMPSAALAPAHGEVGLEPRGYVPAESLAEDVGHQITATCAPSRGWK